MTQANQHPATAGTAATRATTEPAKKESLVTRLRARYRWLDHIIRANESFTRNHGNHYAAAITYFSVLSLIPILMVAFAIAGYVLAGNHALLAQLQTGITKSVPGSLGDTLNQAVGQAIKSRNTVGVIGLLVALYSGVGWMSNLREALTAQWDQQPVKGSFVKTLVLDLIALVGLGLALVVSFAITIAGTALGTLLLKLVGLEHNSWAHVLLVVATVVLSIGANWLVFLWVIARLPRERVGLRSALRGALAAAVGFEILKQLATVLLRSTSSSPTGAVFGSVISLLVFANLVSRFLLMVTAWTATARENQRARPVPVPAPAVIRPIVQNRTGLGPVAAAGLVAAGALTGHFLGRRPR